MAHYTFTAFRLDGPLSATAAVRHTPDLATAQRRLLQAVDGLGEPGGVRGVFRVCDDGDLKLDVRITPEAIRDPANWELDPAHWHGDT